MCKEAQSLCGKHDFAAFAASGSVAKSTVRTIYRAEVRRQGEDVVFTVLGDGFLYNMVRIIAGTLMEVGHGQTRAGCIARAISTGDRLQLGQTAPACGLALMAACFMTATSKKRWDILNERQADLPIAGRFFEIQEPG